MINSITIKDVKMRIGTLVRVLRKQEGISQEELGEKLNLSRITIQNLEAGKNPTMDTYLKVLQYFDLLAQFDNYVKQEIHNHNLPSLY